LFRELHWINTPWAIVVPAFFGNALPPSFRQFFIDEHSLLVKEAALLDGAGRFGMEHFGTDG